MHGQITKMQVNIPISKISMFTVTSSYSIKCSKSTFCVVNMCYVSEKFMCPKHIILHFQLDFTTVCTFFIL